MQSDKPYAASCDENREPILQVLKPRLQPDCRLLEIGSGTGQHAIFMVEAMPGVTWQTSDRSENHDGIRMWLDEAGLENALPPLALDVLSDVWPTTQFDAVFSANTAHIMPVEAVEAMFRGVGNVLRSGGRFFLYGPFMYGGRHTSNSNERFDGWLKSVAPHQGVRDFDWLKKLADQSGLELEEDVEMPVNNRTLIWTKVA